jgi:hypothetical protein
MCGTGIWANLVRRLQQALGDFVVNTGQADIETCPDRVTGACWTKVHFGVDRNVGRQGHLHFARHKFQRTQETGRPASRKQLLGIGAATRGQALRA